MALKSFSRRDFLLGAAGLAAASPFSSAAFSIGGEPIIDIHQHTNYSDRTNGQLIAHQKAMGVTKTVLLPAGSLYGLDAKCGSNRTVLELAHQLPKQFVFFANEVTDLPGARQEIESYLKKGAIGIGEQKFRVGADSIHMEMVAGLAQEYGVPVLMHFMHATYNTGIENFHKILAKYPKVNFIGHAQTWWGNIDKEHVQKTLYPLTKVVPGGITDRLLSDFPNMYGDLSAGSGLNSLIRDEEQTHGFLDRHQNKLMFGSDCNDVFGRGPACQGAQILAAIRRLAPSKSIERKILYENARRLLKL